MKRVCQSKTNQTQAFKPKEKFPSATRSDEPAHCQSVRIMIFQSVPRRCSKPLLGWMWIVRVIGTELGPNYNNGNRCWAVGNNAEIWKLTIFRSQSVCYRLTVSLQNFWFTRTTHHLFFRLLFQKDGIRHEGKSISRELVRLARQNHKIQSTAIQSISKYNTRLWIIQLKSAHRIPVLLLQFADFQNTIFSRWSPGRCYSLLALPCGRRPNGFSLSLQPERLRRNPMLLPVLLRFLSIVSTLVHHQNYSLDQILLFEKIRSEEYRRSGPWRQSHQPPTKRMQQTQTTTKFPIMISRLLRKSPK